MVASRRVAVDEASEPLGHPLDVGVVFDKVFREIQPFQLRKVLVSGAQQMGQNDGNVELQIRLWTTTVDLICHN